VGRYTPVEERIEALAHRMLAGAPARGARARLVEFLVFGAKQAWACVFGALLLVALVAARVWYPDDAALARNDLLVLVAVAIQIGMVVGRLESGRELWVIVVFHVVGTGMELFKTSVGSWSYEEGGVLHIGAVPLFSGFMYAAVGSYMVRVHRLFDLRFARYPPIWLTVVVAVAIYANFFTHHYVVDVRWFLVLAIGLVYARTVMHVHVFRSTFRMPILVSFVLVALFIWIAENIATAAGAWIYPHQEAGWELVPLTKLVAWFLLMTISVVLVTFVYPPRPLDGGGTRRPVRPVEVS
jgi:uncharacterized membrane protein YoaT (DUF817 family)